MSYVETFYPENKAGGFTRADGTVAFYLRVNALLSSEMHVLDYGAGRGAQLHDQRAPLRTSLAKLKGKVAKLVGADIDDAVLENAFVDEAIVFKLGEPLPFADRSFDVIIADWVLEHVADPVFFETEVRRLLKTGGWFCARTPSRFGITGLGAQLIPSAFHARLLKVLQPGRKERDVFPTTYLLNTRRALTRYFRPNHWENASYVVNAEPPYALRSRVAMVITFLYWRIVPSLFYTNLHVFMRKTDARVA